MVYYQNVHKNGSSTDNIYLSIIKKTANINLCTIIKTANIIISTIIKNY